MDQKFDSKQLRNAAGQFATGITVITVRDGHQVRGMTANSFTSVSLDPPLVLVSVANTAEMYRRISKAGGFGVSVLGEHQLDMSNLFSGRLPNQETVDFKKLGNLPVLGNSLAAFACKLYDTVPAGDHTLFIGQVEALEIGEGDPLLYFSGGYESVEKQPQPGCVPDFSAGRSAEFVFDMEKFNAVGW